MLNVSYAQCLKYALDAKYHYAECRYTECCYAEYRGTASGPVLKICFTSNSDMV